jgi:hypothetical protein
MQAARLPLQSKSANADYELLGEKGWGVSEKAPLQDQLSKRMRVWRARVEQQRCKLVAEMCEQPAIFEGEMDIGKIAITSCPAFGDNWNNSTQDLAALHLRRLFLLLFRFGMKRAGRLPRSVFCCHCSEHAMIRDRNPGTDRNRNARATHARFHIQCWLWSARTRPRFKAVSCHRTPNSSSTAWTQTFSSASVIGAAPVAVTSGGTNGTLGRMATCDWSGVCLMRVDISIALKRRAAAR